MDIGSEVGDDVPPPAFEEVDDRARTVAVEQPLAVAGRRVTKCGGDMGRGGGGKRHEQQTLR
ncbi:hypothetical protein GCM10014713_19250 [Streptomyces purpureus]|uniref:Uncharacterized protein n=1 Tax=Streptomyces purpureus TaxID=1951 RepID=A0A918GZE0_9ACTN|nr:hypothetical protein GCM10014713_19250 [Streptomyces purpureus]